MTKLTKAQRTRVVRVLNNLGGPIRHLKKNKLETLFPDELEQLLQVHKKILDKAQEMGFDPEESLHDVVKGEWEYAS